MGLDVVIILSTINSLVGSITFHIIPIVHL